MSENISLFASDKDAQTNLFAEQSTDGGKIDVVQMEFVGAENLNWAELFAGFDRLYAITYSSGIGFICALLQQFQYAEVIFGFEGVMNSGLKEIMAYQFKTIERLRTTSNQAEIDLISRIDKRGPARHYNTELNVNDRPEVKEKGIYE